MKFSIPSTITAFLVSTLFISCIQIQQASGLKGKKIPFSVNRRTRQLAHSSSKKSSTSGSSSKSASKSASKSSSQKYPTSSPTTTSNKSSASESASKSSSQKYPTSSPTTTSNKSASKSSSQKYPTSSPTTTGKSTQTMPQTGQTLMSSSCSGDNDCPPSQYSILDNCAATQAPITGAPTFTPATGVGSFDIYSIGNVAAQAVSGTTVELLAMYNASFRCHKTKVLMSTDCITPFMEGAANAFNVTDTQDVSLGSGNIAYNSTIGIDISILNTTEYWEDLPGGALGGVFDLCLESAIYFVLPGEHDTNEKMNFVNTNLTLTVEMDANFKVTTINAERKDASEENLNLDYSHYVTAYQCTADNLETEATGEVYSQGDELKICVKSTEPSIVQVRSIKSLVLSQTGPDAGEDFPYITDGEPTSDELASTTCAGTVCHAGLQLLGRYFTVDEPGNLTASGSVELKFESGRRLTVDVPIAGAGIRGGGDLLSLVEKNSARRMEDTSEDSSPFDVKISLNKPVDGSGSDYYGASFLMTGMTAAIGGAIIMV